MENKIFTAQEIIDKRRALWERYKDIERDKEFINSISLVLTQTSPQGLKLRKEIKEFPEKLIEMVFVIVDKNLQTVPFFLNEVQKELAKIINQDRADFKDGKCNFLEYLILKGRQQGKKEALYKCGERFANGVPKGANEETLHVVVKVISC